jgi:TnpA family transposase
MPVNFLTDSERRRLNSFPLEITTADLVAFFTLSTADLDQLPKTSTAHNQLGFALQLCTLRYLGFCPDSFSAIPKNVVAFIAGQLGIKEATIEAYGSRSQTRTDHFQLIQKYLGFRKATRDDLATLDAWLLERALEHNRPTLLLEMLCERLHALKLVRPGISLLERMISTARSRAIEQTWRLVEPLLTQQYQTALDKLLEVDEQKRRTLLVWFRTSATSSSPASILSTLEKINELRALGVEEFDLSVLNPNRLKLLAQIGRKADSQQLQRLAPNKRYPILIAFLHQALCDTIDEAVDLYDRFFAEAYSRAGRELDEFRRSVAKATNEKVRLFHKLGHILLDPQITDAEVRAFVYREISPKQLRAAVDECERIMRPDDDSYFDLLATRYYRLRQFAPAFLDTFVWRAAKEDDPLIEAIEVLRELNAEQIRKVPDDAPLEFIPDKWLSFVIDENQQFNRRYYELCLLWQIREAVRAGNLWIEGSRRYANPESYLIAPARWSELRVEACRLMKAPQEGELRLAERTNEFHQLARCLDEQLCDQRIVRIENGELIVSPLEAEERPASAIELEDLIADRLPSIDLPALLIEVDSWVGFSEAFTHAGGSEARKRDLLPTLYASILAQSGNFGLTQMAQMSDFTYRQLAWTTMWYLREETLKAATTQLVNFHYQQPLSQVWGGGTLSSSDGQRFPVTVKTSNATALPRYFGYGRGLTFYTWTSDQHSQFGTKVIPATLRDATVVLDEILDNETELPLHTHSTDTSGYTEIIFALFDLLGLEFAPRIRDLGEQRLFRVDEAADYPQVRQLLRGKINRELILDRWEDLLRVAGSLKLGWVTASLLIGKLHAMPRQNSLVKLLHEYGRLVKTNFILRYLGSEEYRRRINLQLNKGEALHALRRFLFVAQQGEIRKRQPEEQLNQAACLNLVTNAVIVWNTVYMSAVLEQLKREGRQIDIADTKHLSPVRYEHINVFGKYKFPVAEELSRRKLRPLRKPREVAEPAMV